MANLRKLLDLSRSVIRVSLPLFPVSYEVRLGELLDPSNVDERIAKLGTIKTELESAIVAVERLQEDANAHKTEIQQLQTTVTQLRDDKKAAEDLLSVPQESFVRLIGRANARGRLRGLIEGAIIGFVTGLASSYAVWYWTSTAPSSP